MYLETPRKRCGTNLKFFLFFWSVVQLWSQIWAHTIRTFTLIFQLKISVALPKGQRKRNTKTTMVQQLHDTLQPHTYHKHIKPPPAHTRAGKQSRVQKSGLCLHAVELRFQVQRRRLPLARTFGIMCLARARRLVLGWLVGWREADVVAVVLIPHTPFLLLPTGGHGFLLVGLGSFSSVVLINPLVFVL